MKIICRKLLQCYLKLLVVVAVFFYRPIIIAIAGSTNKHFFKEQIKDRLVLAGFAVRSNPKDFNTEIGLPLAILNLPSGYHSYKKWWPIIWRAPAALFKKLPRILVLELGVSDRGNMKYLLSLVEPRMVIITDITQRYLEGFDDIEELMDEYEYLVGRVNHRNGLVVLNYDNLKVRELAEKTKAEVCFFSLNDDIVVKNSRPGFWSASIIKKEEGAQQIIIRHETKQQEHRINRPGDHHIYALLAGLIAEEKIGGLDHD